MLRVALTGGVGSGKSSAADMLRGLGAHVSQSDEVGRAMMQPGQPIYHAMREHFGAGIVLSNGELDRSALADIAFKQGRVEELNAIVHPRVIAAQARWMESVAAQDPYAVAVVESALVFETKYGGAVEDNSSSGPVDTPWRARFDRIVVITASLDSRRMRYVQRNPGKSAEVALADFEHRAATQWSDERKAVLADFVLSNDGSLEDLRDSVGQLYMKLRQDATDLAAEAM